MGPQTNNSSPSPLTPPPSPPLPWAPLTATTDRAAGAGGRYLARGDGYEHGSNSSAISRNMQEEVEMGLTAINRTVLLPQGKRVGESKRKEKEAGERGGGKGEETVRQQQVSGWEQARRPSLELCRGHGDAVLPGGGGGGGLASSPFGLEGKGENRHIEKTRAAKVEKGGGEGEGATALSMRGKDSKKVNIAAGRNGGRWSEKRERKRGPKIDRVGKGAPAQNDNGVTLEAAQPEWRAGAKRSRKESMAGRRRAVEGHRMPKDDENGSRIGNGDGGEEQGLNHRRGSFVVGEEIPEPLGSQGGDGSEVR